MAELMYLDNVVTLELCAESCTGCGMCEIVCPHAVFKMDNRKACIVNKNACIECGACALNCVAGAIKVQSGVGCASAILNSYVNGKEPSCCCGDDSESPCC